MSESYSSYGFWADFDGRKVVLDGHVHVLRVSSYVATFPRKERVINVHADPEDKTSKWYRDVRRQLGDDWSTDVLQSEGVEESIVAQHPDIADHAIEWLQAV